MGVVSIGSNNSLDKADPNGLPNPDPSNYTIIRSLQIGYKLIVEIVYHDCTNYEGKKILVFEDCNINMLTAQKLIDPHFSNNKSYYSPIARFQPTKKGWEMACYVANVI